MPNLHFIYVSPAMKSLIDYREKDIMKHISVLTAPLNEDGTEMFLRLEDWLDFMKEVGFDIYKKTEEQNLEVINQVSRKI